MSILPNGYDAEAVSDVFYGYNVNEYGLIIEVLLRIETTKDAGSIC